MIETNKKAEMKFEFQHLFFDVREIHHESDLPSWLLHKDNKWFLQKHVLTLPVGQSIDTDFQKITRIF
jgi:hypothetical protein